MREVILKRATEAMLGLITGVFAAGAVVARIIVAPYTNRHPKLFLAMGSFMFFIAPIFYIFSTSPFELLIARIFHGIGIAIFTISVIASVVFNQIKKRKRDLISDNLL